MPKWSPHDAKDNPIRFMRRALQGRAAAGVFVSVYPAVRAGGLPERPNIVFIMADDLDFADLSCYGRPDYTTPHMDQLARDGMMFMQAYANSPVC